VPFRPAIVAAVTAGVLMACTAMLLPMEEFTQHMHVKSLLIYEHSISEQNDLIRELTTSRERWHRSDILRTIAALVRRTVLEPPDRAVDTLWGTMRTSRRADPAWNGTTPGHRALLAYRSLLELLDQRTAWERKDSGGSPATHLYAGFASEEFAGASVQCGESCPLVDALRYDAEGGNCTFWEADPFTQEAMRPTMTVPFQTSGRPWYKVQARLAEDAMQGRRAWQLERAWSELYLFVDGNIGLTRTAPLAYCGNYSCFEGVVAADVTLPMISHGCAMAWREFQDLLSEPAYHFSIDTDNSAVFVVAHKVPTFPDQQGLLVGASELLALNGTRLTPAIDSPHGAVQKAARAVLRRFGSWNASALEEGEQLWTASGKEGNESELCDLQAADCMQVGTLSVALDSSGTRWLVVMASPAAAFSARAEETRQKVGEKVKEMQSELDCLVNRVRASGAAAFLVTTALSVCIGICLSMGVSGPLRRLYVLMRRLGELDFAHDEAACARLQAGGRSRMREVSELEDAFCRLSRCIQTFARFVPEAVVRSIVRGDEKAARLHVSRREVTIMFSDIRDFTSISESLPQRDLVFLLTRYLSIMTRIAESFEGVVAEILGDGLLIFWNTPVNVEDHAAKACATAVAMQQALEELNAEFSMLNLPTLAVRIGLHTGVVLSGNMGSDMKMKFGCMGDPVNLASRLEGLCKEYGVGIICSSVTHEALPSSEGFICRRLDLVQVKGRREPVLLYEVMGRECPAEVVGDDSGSLGGLSYSSVFSSAVPALRKSPCAAAMEAIECSTQGLRDCEGLDWDTSLARRLRRLAQRRSALGGLLGGIGAGTAGSEGGVAGDASGCCPPMCSSVTAAAAAPVAEELSAHARRYEEALEAFQGARFGEAKIAAAALAADKPGDMAAQRLLRLAEKYHEAPDLSQEQLARWTGISVMTEKYQ